MPLVQSFGFRLVQNQIRLCHFGINYGNHSRVWLKEARPGCMSFEATWAISMEKEWAARIQRNHSCTDTFFYRATQMQWAED